MANSAYDDDVEVNKPLTPVSGQGNVELGAIGGQVQSVQNAYDEETAAQSNQHAAPPPPPYCVRILNWFPIRYASWLGGIVLLAGVILDFIFNQVRSSIRCSEKHTIHSVVHCTPLSIGHRTSSSSSC